MVRNTSGALKPANTSTSSIALRITFLAYLATLTGASADTLNSNITSRSSPGLVPTTPTSTTTFHGGEKNTIEWIGGEGKWTIDLMWGDDAFLTTLVPNIEASALKADVLIDGKVGRNGSQYYLKFLPSDGSDDDGEGDVYSAKFTMNGMTGFGGPTFVSSDSDSPSANSSSMSTPTPTGPDPSVSANPTQLGPQTIGVPISDGTQEDPDPNANSTAWRALQHSTKTSDAVSLRSRMKSLDLKKRKMKEEEKFSVRVCYRDWKCGMGMMEVALITFLGGLNL